jgi:peroxiredoxin
MKLNRIATALACAAIALTGMTLTSTASAHDHMSKDKAKVGEKAPDFTLTDFQGNEHTLSDYTEDGKIVVLEWFNPMCPYVVLHYDKQTTMNDLKQKYEGKDVVWLAVNSAYAEHPTHKATMKTAKEWGVNHPILNDETGKVGRMYGAKTTPHMYIIHKDGTLVYDGAIDNDRRNNLSGNEKVNYVDDALAAITSGKKVSVSSTKPYGCSVKYASK